MPSPANFQPALRILGFERRGVIALQISQLCNQTMDKVVRNLSGSRDRPVVDMTGIAESFQYRIPILRSDADREANTRAAILDQLGVKLESRKGPMEVIVVDHVNAPSPN